MYSRDEHHSNPSMAYTSYDVADVQGYEAPSLPYIPYTPVLTLAAPHASPTQSIIPPSPVFVAPVSSSIEPPVSSGPVVASEPPVVRKKRRVPLWLALGSIVLLMAILAVSSYELTAYFNRSTPDKTLKTFCTALQQESYQTAYNQLAKNLQVQITENQFATSLATDKISQCTYGTTSEANTTTKTSLTLVHAQSHYVNNDIVTLTKQADTIWRISDLQVAS